MNVSYTLTTSAKLSNLPIVNGQLIYLQDVAETYYDDNGARKQISSVKVVSSLPESGRTGVLYAVPVSSGSTQANAHVWDATNSQYVMVSSPVSIASTAVAGIVKPDGSSITITPDGTISAIGTTYASLPAAQGSTAVSLVTAGDKYNWDNKSDTIIFKGTKAAWDALSTAEKNNYSIVCLTDC